uniref:Uncharacterized protein n=1 Tax=Romanomermis culicivorax TaxID=13658 RepID=A0A915KRQ1_ROMCU
MKKIKKIEEKIKKKENQLGVKTAGAKVTGTEIACTETASAEVTQCRSDPVPNWLTPKRWRLTWGNGGTEKGLSVLCMTITLVC